MLADEPGSDNDLELPAREDEHPDHGAARYLFSTYDHAAEDEDTINSRRVWQRVILHAVEEARGHMMQGVPPHGKKRVRLRAIQWLTNDTKDLRFVCELAGVSINSVLSFSRRRYGQKS